MSRTRPTWDVATDEEILEEIETIASSGYQFVDFGHTVWKLIQDRGLETKVRELLGSKCLTP